MTDEKDIEFSLDLDDFGDDDSESSLSNYSPSGPTEVNPLILEHEELKIKTNTLQTQLAELQSALNSGKKNDWVTNIINKYADIDPNWRAFSLELLEEHGKITAESIQRVSQYIDTLQANIAKQATKADLIDRRLTNVDNDIKIRTLIKSSMERFFKKPSISENSVDKATEVFAARRKKDPAFDLQVRGISSDPKLTNVEKDKLLGTLISKSYQEHIISKKKPGTNDPTPKERIGKDESIDKIERKHEKSKAASAKVDDTDVQEPEYDVEARRAKLKGLFGR
jgi:hypothetical protein